MSVEPDTNNGDQMNIEKSNDSSQESSIPNSITPEVETYLILLVIVHLIDHKRYEESVSLSTRLIEKMDGWNRRTLDPLSSKVYFYYSRSYELVNRLEDIRPKLLSLQRTATLRHNFDGQITLLNLLLRNYLTYNLYDMAYKLAIKSGIKESNASSHELARYYYYLGRIKSIQMNYQEAYNDLQQAIRKAPTNSAKGFRASVIKLSSIVQLLLGEIPEKSLFTQKGLSHVLKPYMNLTASVRRGDLQEFQKCVNEYEDLFRKDKTISLINRMRNTVIMTGLRKINLAYSRINFADICDKLKLESPEDAEYIVAKAIRDGIIDATIDHEGGYVQSKETYDVYSTDEPQKQFNKRIEQFIGIHNEAVKSMRYKPETKTSEIDEEYKKKIIEENELLHSFADEDDEDDEYF